MASRLRTGGIGALTAVGLFAVGTIGTDEGLKLKSYPDVIGVWTVCRGETEGIHKGMTFTKAECDKMFVNRLVQFETRMRSCLKSPDSIPDKPYVAFLSLSYNIGTGGFCSSTVAKKVNAGDIKGACNYLIHYNRAGGVVWRGLTDRRKRERAYCLAGL